MFIRKISKALLACGIALTLGACSNTTTQEDISYEVLCPTGAPALATLGAKNVENTTITYVDGSDPLVAELSKKDGSYDAIVAPINVGAKVYAQSDAYQLAAVVTWGNLYLVGSQDNAWEDANNSIALFGENAVPGLVYNKVLGDKVKAQPTWYNAVSDAQQALLTGKANIALLAQPAAAATIAKAKENGTDLKVIANFQQLWQQEMDNDTTGYPQAGIFVKKDSKKDMEKLLSGIQVFDEDADPDQITKTIDEIGADQLGVPNTQIAVNTWDAQNIRYVSAENAQEEVKQFLELFSIEMPETLITQ